MVEGRKLFRRCLKNGCGKETRDRENVAEKQVVQISNGQGILFHVECDVVVMVNMIPTRVLSMKMDDVICCLEKGGYDRVGFELAKSYNCSSESSSLFVMRFCFVNT